MFIAFHTQIAFYLFFNIFKFLSDIYIYKTYVYVICFKKYQKNIFYMKTFETQF